MKKARILTVLLSVVFCLSILTALPACAQNSYNNKVPKTMKMGTLTFTGNYNAKSKTLTYKVKNVPVDENGIYGAQNMAEYLNQGLIASSSDTRSNQDYAILSNYPDPTGVIVNDMIRSGKIKKLKISMIFKNDDFEGKVEYSFSTKNGRVTKMNWSISEGSSYTYRFTYDSQGNLLKINQSYYEMPEVLQTTTVNYDDGRIESLVDSYDGSNTIIKASYDKAGQILPGRIPAIWNKTYNADGTLKSCQQTIYPEDAENTRKDPVATFTYMTIQ